MSPSNVWVMPNLRHGWSRVRAIESKPHAITHIYWNAGTHRQEHTWFFVCHASYIASEIAHKAHGGHPRVNKVRHSVITFSAVLMRVLIPQLRILVAEAKAGVYDLLDQHWQMRLQ